MFYVNCGDGMHIHNLTVRNFQSVDYIALEDLPRTIVIAGPNGSGKSTILNAIRLMKAVTASYNTQEVQHTLTEIGLANNQNSDLAHIFSDPEKPIEITARISLSQRDKAYLREHGESLTYSAAISQSAGGEPARIGGPGSSPIRNAISRLFDLTRMTDDQKRQTKRLAGQQFDRLLKDLNNEYFDIRLSLRKDAALDSSIPFAIFIAMSSYRPRELGTVFFKNAHRQFQRMPNLQFNFKNEKDHLGYYWESKTAKQILGDRFIRNIILEKAGLNKDDRISESLIELFDRFLPGKRFTGPKIDENGKIIFPVMLPNGRSHDLDDLSSGEKELIYGYVHLVSEGLKDSIIIIDEPEVHLNPRMIKGLVEYYDEHFSKEFCNQMIFTSHSDVLVRDLVSTQEVAVIHLDTQVGGDKNQAVRVDHFSKMQRLLYDLAGDKAAFLPAAKVLIVEGQKGSLDELFINKIFPIIASQVNVIPAGSKSDVKKLMSDLKDISESQEYFSNITAIVDKDFDENKDLEEGVTVLDRYSIENYLLDENYLTKAINSFSPKQVNIEEVRVALMASCVEVKKRAKNEELRRIVANAIYVSSEIRTNRASDSIVDDLQAAFITAKDRVAGVEFPNLFSTIDQIGDDLDEMLKNLPGKQLMAEFSGHFEQTKKIGPVSFGILVIDKMVSDNYVPEELHAQLKTLLGIE